MNKENKRDRATLLITIFIMFLLTVIFPYCLTLIISDYFTTKISFEHIAHKSVKGLTHELYKSQEEEEDERIIEEYDLNRHEEVAKRMSKAFGLPIDEIIRYDVDIKNEVTIRLWASGEIIGEPLSTTFNCLKEETTISIAFEEQKTTENSILLNEVGELMKNYKCETVSDKPRSEIISELDLVSDSDIKIEITNSPEIIIHPDKASFFIIFLICIPIVTSLLYLINKGWQMSIKITEWLYPKMEWLYSKINGIKEWIYCKIKKRK